MKQTNNKGGREGGVTCNYTLYLCMLSKKDKKIKHTAVIIIIVMLSVS